MVVFLSIIHNHSSTYPQSEGIPTTLISYHADKTFYEAFKLYCNGILGRLGVDQDMNFTQVHF